MIKINPNATYEILLRMAEKLLDAGYKLKEAIQERTSTPYPPASKPGEYPHARTYTGHDEVFVIPTTPDGVVRNGMKVFVGYSNLAWYMPFLEEKRQRLGLQGLFQDMAPELMVARG